MPYFRSRSIARYGRFLGIAGIMMTFGIMSNGVHAQSVVLDFPHQNTPDLPAGLAAWPEQNFGGLATIAIPFLELDSEGAVLATVVFLDAEARIVMVKWVGEKTTILANNLSEGVQGWNQRTIEVPYDLLRDPGSLVIETDAEIQPVHRVVLTWAWPSRVFMGTAAHTVEYVESPKRILTSRDLSDESEGVLPDTWSSGIWNASLQEKTEPLDESLQFVVPMDTLPKAVVFRAKLLGLPMGSQVRLWVNGRKSDFLAVDVPELTSTGYFQSMGRIGYAGWREASVVLPAEFFQVGENTIVLGRQNGAFIKDAALELSFEKEGAPLPLEGAPVSVPTLSSDDPEVPELGIDFDEPTVIVGQSAP